MFFANRLNSGMLYQTAPSGGNMSMRKTLGFVAVSLFFGYRRSRALNGSAGTRVKSAAIANNWLG